MSAIDSSAGGTAIAVRGLRHAFNGHTVLDGVDLDVPAGTVLALLGPSGCGKSTLLKSLAGLLRPQAGSIAFGDAVVCDARRHEPPERRSLGMVFQDYALWPHMSVAANVGFPLEMRGVARRERPARVQEALALVGLGEHAARRPSELSGGQQQRVACARAMITKPHVVFADEPTGALDSKSGANLLGYLRHCVDDLGQTIIMVTHDAKAASYADRTLMLLDGRIVDDIASPTAESVSEAMAGLEG